MFKWKMLIVLLGLVLLLGMAGAGILLAQGELPHFAPRPVEKLSWSAPVRLEPAPVQPRLTDMTALEKQVGFSILLPTYLPSGCDLRERYYISLAKEVILNYSCVNIGEKQGLSVDQPFVGKDSVTEMTIGGKPALEINGIWSQRPGAKEWTWQTGYIHQLVFERQGLVIRLSAPVGAPLTHITKDELIRIAESIQ